MNPAIKAVSAEQSPMEYALEYAAADWPVVPCAPDSKKPYLAREKDQTGKPIPGTGGFKKASTDAAQIKAWWTQWPQAMIGVPTGRQSGFWILDVDNKPAERKDGLSTLAELETQNSTLPETVRVTTPSGGLHIYFAWPPTVEIRNRASLGPGIDVRGEGG